MIKLQTILIILFLFFWAFHILRRNFFWLYFWQKRGSRFNRFLNGLKENPRVLLTKTSFLAILFLIFAPFFGKINFLFEGGVFFIYLIFGLYSIYLFFASILIKDFSFHFFLVPKIKRDVVFLFIFIFLIESLLVGFALKFFLGGELYIPLVLFLLFELFFPLIFILVIFFYYIVSFLPNKFFEIKARKKIKEKKNLITIGICGSYGKTLTKEFLYQILKEKFNVLKTEGGGPELKDITRLINKKLTKNHQLLIFEISAYKRGEISKICKVLNPKIIILTGISDDHIALFGNFKNVLNTNFEAVNSLKEDGVAILNVGDKEIQKLYQRTVCKKYGYSTSEEKGDVFAKDIKIEKERLSFLVVSPWGKEEIILNFSFPEYIENFLGASVCALELGMNLREIKERAKNLNLPQTFLEKIITKKGPVIIDDTSSHNFKSFLLALDYLKSFKAKKKIIIASPILELGKEAPTLHNSIGKKIGEVCDLAIFTLPLYLKEIKFGAVSSGMKEKNIYFSSNPREILKIIKPFLKKNTLILLEGEVPAILRKILTEL